MSFSPRHWEKVPGVKYPDEVSVVSEFDVERLLRTHCLTRDVSVLLGLQYSATRDWLEKCEVPREEHRFHGKVCYFWERQAVKRAVRRYQRKRG